MVACTENASSKQSPLLPRNSQFGENAGLIAEGISNHVDPRLVMLPGGDAMATWQTSKGNTFQFWYKRFTAGIWEESHLLAGDDTHRAYDPLQMAADSHGNVIAVWSQLARDEPDSIWFRRYEVTTKQWSSPALLSPPTSEPSMRATDPRLAMDANGNAIVTWLQSHVRKLWARRYHAVSGQWEPAFELASDIAGVPPAVAAGPDGSAVVAWSQPEVTTARVWAKRFDLNTGASTDALPLEEDGNSTFGPEAAVDRFGNVFVAWRRYTEGPEVGVWTNRFDAAQQTWSGRLALEISQHGSTQRPKVAVDSQGNAAVIWRAPADTLQAARYDAGSRRWTVVNGTPNYVGFGTREFVAFDSEGHALTVAQSTEYAVPALRYNADNNRWTGWDFYIRYEGMPTALAFDDSRRAMILSIARDPAAGQLNLVAFRLDAVPASANHCGNGTLEPKETCDDGNELPADGCSDVCEVESGFTCVGAPSVCALPEPREVKAEVIESWEAFFDEYASWPTQYWARKPETLDGPCALWGRASSPILAVSNLDPSCTGGSSAFQGTVMTTIDSGFVLTPPEGKVCDRWITYFNGRQSAAGDGCEARIYATTDAGPYYIRFFIK